MYTPLYVKSNYSFLSSLVRIDALVKKSVQLGIKSIALCDDNMIASMYFYKKAKENGLNPIIGYEMKYHEKSFLLYAKNYQGYQNLLKLVTLADEVEEDDLKKYKEDIMAIVPFDSRELYLELKNIYSFLYVGCATREEEHIAQEITSNIVFANKVLYLEKKESKFFPYAIMMKEKKNVLDNITFQDHYHYLLTSEEVEKISSKEAIQSSNFIAQNVHLTFPKFDNLIPVYENNLGISSEDYLTKLSIQGLTIRLKGKVDEAYQKRLLYELDVIKKMGFADYFLIVYDYVKYAKKNKILVGPGRGSAGGSLVAYALGIIDVDPMVYHLFFERFLNPGRVTMPDIDIDFSDIYRDQVIEYVKNKYGEKKVAGIVAVGTLKAKAVLDDVSKILKIDSTKCDRLKRHISFNDSLKAVFERDEEFRSIVENDERLSLLYEISLYFEGFPKNTTTHASGIIISRVDLDEIIPLIKQEQMYLSSFEMGYLEELGLLKMDFLGNRNLTTIMDILEKIKTYEDQEINFLDIPLDDKDTLKLFYDVDTNGIFQFESDVMKNLLSKLKVTSFEDIVAADALVRPGPDTATYLRRRNHHEKVIYPSKEVEPILEPTYGVMVYQEQIMQIANVMAGFTMSEADTLRRAMSKKKKEELKVQEEKFISGAIKNGYSYEVAKKFYEDILSFAEYGFNKSHAVSYSMIAYKMGYLKVHYPKYFYLSLLSMIIGNEEKTSSIIREARAKGVRFYLPDINRSTEKYEVLEDGILFPLSNIKNIGINTAMDIVKARSKPFENIFECFTRLVEKGLNRKTIESLIYASCMENFGYNQNTLICNLDNLLTYAFVSKGLENTVMEHPEMEIHEEFSHDVLMQHEKELFGFYLSYHPTLKYKAQYRVVDLSQVQKYISKVVEVVILVEKIRMHTDKNGNRMAFITGSDELAEMDFIFFHRAFAEVVDMKKGDVLLVRGKVEKKENFQIIVEKAKILE